MKKLLVILAFLTCFQAKAGLIMIDSDQNTSQIGDIITITLTGQDLTPFWEFDFEFTFDDSLYSFISNSLTSDLALLDEVDPAGGLRPPTTTSEGILFYFWQWEAFSPVGAEFTLASFQLNVIGAGQNSLNIERSYFGGPDGEIDANAGHPLHTSVTDGGGASTPVSEPATLLLLSLGFAGLVARRKTN